MGSYWAIASVCFLIIGCLTALLHERLFKRRLPAIISIAPTCLALCATLALYINSNTSPVQATLFKWGSILPSPNLSISIAYYVDAWGSLLAILAVFLGLCTQVLLANRASDNHSEPNWTNICVYGALTVLLNLLFSASLVMLSMSWFAIGIIVYLFLTAENQHVEPGQAEDVDGSKGKNDLSTRASLAPSQRMFVIKQLIGYSFLGGILFIARAGDVEPVPVTLHSVWLSLAPSILIALGLGAYLGLYPFNAWPSYATRYSAAASVSLSLFPAIASVYVLGRLYPTMVAGSAWPLSNILLFMSLATLVIASLRAWRAMDFNTLLTSIASVELGFVALAFALAPLHNGEGNASGIIDVNAFSSAVLILLNCVLAVQAIAQIGMRLMAKEQRQTWLVPPKLRVALLVAPWLPLIGLPFTLGFVAKSMLFAVSFTFPYILLWPVAGIANVLVIISAVRFMDRVLFGNEREVGSEDPTLRALDAASTPSSPHPSPLPEGGGTVPPRPLGRQITAKASTLWILSPWIIVFLFGLMPNQAMQIVIDPTLRAILGESASFIPPQAGLTGSPLFAATIAVTLAIIVLAFYLYPVPLARLSIIRANQRREVESPPLAAGLRYTILEAIVDVIAVIVTRLSALDGVLRRISNGVRKASVLAFGADETVHENYYFPSLVVLGIILLFIFLG